MRDAFGWNDGVESSGVTTQSDGLRLERLAHAAARLHMAIVDRPRLRSTPPLRFHRPDGSEECFPMLTADEFAQELAEETDREWRRLADSSESSRASTKSAAA